ncbi:MAG: galactokinase [Verrucomicrobiota bacterium]
MKPFTVMAPGRAEVLGNHTDYNEGLVLSIAISVRTTVCGKPAERHTLRLTSEKMQDGWTGDLGNLIPLQEPEPTWPNYVIGVAQALKERNIVFKGGDLMISSNIPVGTGLSSSAALEMASGLAFQQLGEFELNTIELARAGQYAEHHFAGVQCGLLDQISVLAGKSGHLTFIDCQSLEIRHLPLPRGWVFVIVDSGVNHAMSSGKYNKRRKACEAAAHALKIASLRQVTPGELEVKKDQLDGTSFKCAMHPVGETARVAHAVSALAAGNINVLGKLMFESHQSSIQYFENSCAELDFLVAQAARHDACIGARLSGGGFGGATINLVKENQAARFVKDMQNAYKVKYGSKPWTLITPACNGAHTV